MSILFNIQIPYIHSKLYEEKDYVCHVHGRIISHSTVPGPCEALSNPVLFYLAQ